MGNIIDFKAAGRPEDKVALDQSRRESAAAIRQAIGMNQPLSADDQRQIAIQLGELLEKVQRHGTSKASVMRQAGIGSGGDSTKHLGQYAISPQMAETRKGGGRLNKKPKPYLALVTAAASLSGQSLDEAVLSVFSGTEFSTKMARPGSSFPQIERVLLPQTEAQAFEALAQTLQDVVSAVSKKHKLQSYFQAITRKKPTLSPNNDDNKTKGSHQIDPEDISLIFIMIDSNLEWPIELRSPSRDAHNHDYYGDVPPYPAVVLGQWPDEESIDIQVEICEHK